MIHRLDGFLALLTSDDLVLVADTLPEVRLRRLDAPNIRRKLSDRFLVRAFKFDDVLFDRCRDIFRYREQYRMGEADRKNDILPFHLNPVPDAFENKFLHVRGLNTLNHILHMRSERADKRFAQTRAVFRGDQYAG